MAGITESIGYKTKLKSMDLSRSHMSKIIPTHIYPYPSNFIDEELFYGLKEAQIIG